MGSCEDSLAVVAGSSVRLGLVERWGSGGSVPAHRAVAVDQETWGTLTLAPGVQ